MNFPHIYEDTGKGGQSVCDIPSRLMKDRIIFLGTEINDQVANAVISQLLILQMDNPNSPIRIYLNSPGGSVTAGMAIYDTIKLMKCDVEITCVGLAASMGAVLLSAGTKGHRYILPNSRVMIHQPLGGASGQASDISIVAKEIMRWKTALTRVLADNTGQDFNKVSSDCERDYYMDAKEALEYGIVDKIISNNA